mmetsp:Transcript_46512/g.92431  ORF Transcript_46512/g.92431 Transcript_46512/m.92431 type:complete len:271 (+) Transcript_46512:1552-2364(+)
MLAFSNPHIDVIELDCQPLSKAQIDIGSGLGMTASCSDTTFLRRAVDLDRFAVLACLGPLRGLPLAPLPMAPLPRPALVPAAFRSFFDTLSLWHASLEAAPPCPPLSVAAAASNSFAAAAVVAHAAASILAFDFASGFASAFAFVFLFATAFAAAFETAFAAAFAAALAAVLAAVFETLFAESFESAFADVPAALAHGFAPGVTSAAFASALVFLSGVVCDASSAGLVDSATPFAGGVVSHLETDKPQSAFALASSPDLTVIDANLDFFA